MKLGRSALALLLAAVLVTLTTPPSNAGCESHETVDLVQASGECRRDANQVRDMYATAHSDGVTYHLESRCKPGDNCGRQERICRTGGRPGTWYILYRTVIATGAETNIGIVCLTPAEERGLAVITPAMVRREMERLSWPAADLQIQPPDGQTLINFDTNFFTDNTSSTTQTVTLLGQRVTIEASPVEYTWHFGDGTADSTTTPGAAYPDLEVTHDYADPGRVSPSVDTTYQGRYRINNGPWEAIPGTLTVPGESVDLLVRSASPHLVGSYGQGAQ